MSQRGATAAQRCPGRGRDGCRRRPRSLEIRFTLFTNCRSGQHKLQTAILLKLICSQCNPFFATEFLIYGFGIYGAKTSPRTVVSAQARVYWATAALLGHSFSFVSEFLIFFCLLEFVCLWLQAKSLSKIIAHASLRGRSAPRQRANQRKVLLFLKVPLLWISCFSHVYSLTSVPLDEMKLDLEPLAPVWSVD